MNRLAILLVLPALAFSLLAGCGGKGLVSVTGTVTLDGKALDRGSVTFHPVKSGPLGVGKIQPDGRYSIETGNQRGIAPGEYAVTVVATADPPKGPPTKGPEVPPTPLTPAKYGRPETSGLRYAVPAAGGKFDIPLQSR